MNRWIWSTPEKLQSSSIVNRQGGVRLYDGHERTAFDCGELYITTQELIWIDMHDSRCVMSLHAALIIFVDSESAGFLGSSPKLVLNLLDRNDPSIHQQLPPSPVLQTPVAVSKHNFVKLSFRQGGQVEAYRALSDVIKRRLWTTPATVANTKDAATLKPNSGGHHQLPVPARPKHAHSGILGIERRMEKEQSQRTQHISKAFEDLSSLMQMAKETVQLSKSITSKLVTLKGTVTNDETVQLKSYLLSLGLNDPVTREVFSGDVFMEKLAKQIAELMTRPLTEKGGMIPLSDVYCYVNRARGLDLLSPDDLLNACRHMQRLKLTVCLRTFPSGVVVLETTDNSDIKIIEETFDRLEKQGSLTAQEYAASTSTAVILAQERLLMTERYGKACRDESEEGLRFYPNKFLF